MKVKYYRYATSNEAQEFIDAKFGNNDIEATVKGNEITLMSLEGPIHIQFNVLDKPLVFDGHEFEELLDYRVEFTIDDKIFSTKSLTHRLSQAQIAEKAVTSWVVSQTRVSKIPISDAIKLKINEERELLKTLKARKAQKDEEAQVNSTKRVRK